MRKTRIASFGVIGALVATLAMIGFSSADHKPNIDIKVDDGKPFFHGVVQSKNEDCERNRYLVVKRVRKGPNQFVKDDITSFRGGWSAFVERPGEYVIKIDETQFCGDDRDVVTRPGGQQSG